MSREVIISTSNPGRKPRNPQKPLWHRILSSWQLYVLITPAVAYLILFKYIPMTGIQIAFRDFKSARGVWGSQWVGFKHFLRFFNSPSIWTLIRNTLSLSVYSLLAGIPLPILLALSMNSLRGSRFKKTVQVMTYAPHFISVVVIVGMINVFFSTSTGIVNVLLRHFGMNQVSFMTSANLFPHFYVWSGVWQNLGWNSIIYMAALSGVDPSLHEAAVMDGASMPQRICHIDFPSILPTIIILLILSSGSIMSVGFEKVYLMQNPLNLRTSEVISTYVYKRGIIDAQYSFSTAVGLFNSLVNIVMLSLVNYLSQKTADTSLW